jgi:hypothetical protein
MKKKSVLFWLQKKKNCSSSTTAIFRSGASANHNGRPTTEKTCTSVPQSDRQFYINADHNQDTSTHRFTAFNNPQRCSHNKSLSSATQISVTNHQPQPPLTRTFQHQHQPQRHHPQCPRLQQWQRINRPSSSNDTTDTTTPTLAPPGPSRITKPRFVRYRRQQRQQIIGGKEDRNRSW